MSRVSRYGSDRTNQKMYFTKNSLKQARLSKGRQQLQQSLEEATFHLRGAFGALICEVGYSYGLNEPQPTVDALEAALIDRQNVCPEINRLNSVASALIKQLEQSLRLIQVPAKSIDAQSDDLIQRTNSSLLSYDQLSQGLELLKELTDALRQTLHQY